MCVPTLRTLQQKAQVAVAHVHMHAPAPCISLSDTASLPGSSCSGSTCYTYGLFIGVVNYCHTLIYCMRIYMLVGQSNRPCSLNDCSTYCQSLSAYCSWPSYVGVCVTVCLVSTVTHHADRIGFACPPRLTIRSAVISFDCSSSQMKKLG